MHIKLSLTNKWLKLIFVVLFVASLFLNFILLARNASGTRVVSKEDFVSLTKTIDNEFSVNGYQEILSKNGMDLMMALPLQSNDDTFNARTKVFVYKSTKENVVIMLEISYSNFPAPTKEEWFASFDYTPNFLNSTKYLSEYDPDLPRIFLATNSFRYLGICYTLTCFSDTATDILAQNELTKFSNNLLSFLKNQK